MSKAKTPQEKKRLSLARDCRNTFGESPHAARKSIPKRKAMQHQQERHIANQVISQVSDTNDSDEIDFMEGVSKAQAALKRRKGFRKYSDEPLGEVIKEKIERRVKQAGRRKKSANA